MHEETFLCDDGCQLVSTEFQNGGKHIIFIRSFPDLLSLKDPIDILSTDPECCWGCQCGVVEGCENLTDI